MNQPSGKIIQIGAAVGDSNTGLILDTYTQHVNPNEELQPFIIELTGITQKNVNAGVDLLDAYRGLIALSKKHKCHKQTVVWGNGDTRALLSQVTKFYPTNSKDWWGLGHREFDTKTIFQALMFANGLVLKSDLQTACKRLDIVFEGRPHDALADAINTFKVFYKLKCLLKNSNLKTVLQQANF